MPVYEFECTNKKCKNIHEEITILAEAKLGSICPKCKCKALHILSCANFHTEETRARRILGGGRKARGTRGRGKSQEEKYGSTWYEKTGKQIDSDLE